jgi:hypothetical protein
MSARGCMDCPSGHPCVDAAQQQPARATAPMCLEEEGSSAAPLAMGQAGDGADARRGGGQQRCLTCDGAATPVRPAREAGAGACSVQPVPADVYRALTGEWDSAARRGSHAGLVAWVRALIRVCVRPWQNRGRRTRTCSSRR